MRILITGGTGFIGSRLALRCLGRGDRVRILAQLNTPAEQDNARELEQAGVEFVAGSVTDTGEVRDAVRDIDLIFHLAAAQHEANVPDQHFWEVNVLGTRNLMEAAVESGVGRVVHGSTIGVYGEARDGAVNEDAPLRPVNIYGITKREGEAVALRHADKTEVVVVRIPETYGPGDRRLLKLFKAIDKGTFFNIGKGENRHHLMYVDDLVDGLLLAAEQPGINGERFLFAGRSILTTNEMIATIARVLDKDPPRIRVPLAPLMLTAIVLESVMKPLGKQPPLHRRRMDFFVKSFVLDGDKAKRVLGFEPRTEFADGARETARWYRERGLLD